MPKPKPTPIATPPVPPTDAEILAFFLSFRDKAVEDSGWAKTIFAGEFSRSPYEAIRNYSETLILKQEIHRHWKAVGEFVEQEISRSARPAIEVFRQVEAGTLEEIVSTYVRLPWEPNSTDPLANLLRSYVASGHARAMDDILMQVRVAIQRFDARDGAT